MSCARAAMSAGGRTPPDRSDGKGWVRSGGGSGKAAAGEGPADGRGSRQSIKHETIARKAVKRIAGMMPINPAQGKIAPLPAPPARLMLGE